MSTPGPAARLLAWIPIALALVVVGFSFSVLSRGLELDEFGTYWVVEASMTDVWSRALRYQGQSPLYYQVVWFFVQLLGTSEVALRLPSVLASLVSIGLTGLVARRLISTQLVLPSVLLFTVGAAFSRELGGYARPYALAVTFFLLSLYSCLVWVQEHKPVALAGTVLFFVACFYTHYLFAPTALVLTLVLWSGEKSPLVRPAPLFLAGAAGAILLLPSLYQLLLLKAKIPAYQFTTTPSTEVFLADAFPRNLIALLALVLLVFFLSRESIIREKIDAFTASLLAVWVMSPPICLFGASVSGILTVYVPRYFFWREPGIAIAEALLLSAFASANVRNLLLCMLCVSALLSARIDYGPDWVEEWRASITSIDADPDDESHCIALYSGLIESDSPGWLSDSERSRYLSTSIRYYTEIERIHQFPWNPHKPEMEPYTTSLTASLQRDCERVTAVVRIIPYIAGGRPFDTTQLIGGYMSSIGFAAVAEARFDGVSRMEFAKAP